MRTFITSVALAGSIIFGGAFIASFVNPVFVETLARDAIRWELERKVGKRIDVLESGKLAEIARRLSGQNAAEIAHVKRKLAEGFPQKVAAIAAQMRNPDCACRQAIEKTVTGLLEGGAADLSRINERLELLIRTKYMAVAASVTREFRIFSGANALVFMLLALASSLRKRAGLQLVLPAVVLLGAAGLVGWLYLFKQDWMHTLIFSEYVGFSYFAYLALAVALLADILFNRARFTSQLLNVVFSVFGVAVHATPC